MAGSSEEAMPIDLTVFQQRYSILVQEYDQRILRILHHDLTEVSETKASIPNPPSISQEEQEAVRRKILKTSVNGVREIQRDFVRKGYYGLADLIEILLYRAHSTFRTAELTDEVKSILTTPVSDVREALNEYFRKNYDGNERYENEAPSLVKAFKLDLLRAAGTRDVAFLKDLLNDCPGELVWKDYRDRSPLHTVVIGGETKTTIKFLECVLEYVQKYEETYIETLAQRPIVDLCLHPRNVHEFLARLNEDKQTVLHLAAENESFKVVEWLCKHRDCRNLLHLPDKNNFTPLELMYAKTPKAVVGLLNQAADNTLKSNYFSDGKLEVRLDFENVVGWGKEISKKNLIETSLLAGIVYSNADEYSQRILVHPIVKTFLDLKWKKMSSLIYIWTALYIFVHLVYTLFVIQVFIISFPPSTSNSTENETKSDLTFSEYLLGRRGHGEPENILFIALFWLTKVLGKFAALRGWSYAFLVLGIFLGILEISEFYISVRMMSTAAIYEKVDQHSNFKFGMFVLKILIGITVVFTGLENSVLMLVVLGLIYSLVECVYAFLLKFKPEWILFKTQKNGAIYFLSFLNGLKTYFNNFENVLQLLFISFMTHVFTVVTKEGKIRETDYVNGAFGVILAYTLILLQFMNIFGFAKYIQILKTVIQSFLKTMLAYIGLLVAFCISFSILFHEDGLFETLPDSLFRVLPMMGGEFNWDDIFIKNETIGHPRFYIPRHVLHASFNIIVTIVLINLLIGLTVGDITKILGKSEQVHRGIQVERLYIMENFVLAFNRLKCDCSFLTSRCNRQRNRDEETGNKRESIPLDPLPSGGIQNDSISETNQDTNTTPISSIVSLPIDKYRVIPVNSTRMTVSLPIKSLSRKLQKSIRDLLEKNEQGGSAEEAGQVNEGQ